MNYWSTCLYYSGAGMTGVQCSVQPNLNFLYYHIYLLCWGKRGRGCCKCAKALVQGSEDSLWESILYVHVSSRNLTMWVAISNLSVLCSGPVALKEKPSFFCRLLSSHFAYTNPIYSIAVVKVTILSWDLPTFLSCIPAILTLKTDDCSYSKVLPPSSIALPTTMLITWIILGASGVSLTNSV